VEQHPGWLANKCELIINAATARMLGLTSSARWSADRESRVPQGEVVMQALVLMIVYLLTAAAVQVMGFFISRGIEYVYPTLGLTTFLIVFLAAFILAWPIAHWITVTGIRQAGFRVEGPDPRAT
jgi:hypothetical protein